MNWCASLAALSIAVHAAAAQHCPTFDGPFAADELDESVRASLVFDDGSGPALYLAGDFTHAYGVSASRVVRWDGATWSPVGPGFDERVNTLAALDFGTGPALYAGGAFTVSGSTIVRGVARWNGTQWMPIGAGVTDASGFEINALARYDFGQGPQLFVTGYFHGIGSQTNAQSMARWDGTQWFHLGSSLGNATPEIGRGYALAVYDSGAGEELYVGGNFLYAGAVITSPNIARWNASGWQPVASGVGSYVRSMTRFDDGSGEKLVFGTGRLGSSAYVYAWNGQALAFVGPYGLQNSSQFGVSALRVFDDGSGASLYAAGDFFGEPNGPVCSSIARWNGSQWNPLASGMIGRPVFTLAEFDDGAGPALFAAGDFAGAGELLSPRFARWRQGAWTQVGESEELDESPRVFLSTDLVHGGPRVIVGGDFRRSGSIGLLGIGAWDATTWSAMAGLTTSNNTERSVRDLEVFDDGNGPALYATGTAWTSNTFHGNLARWDGAQWVEFGGGLSGSTGWGYALHSFGGELFVGGRYAQVGTLSAYGLAAWNGATWRACGGFASGAFQGTVFDMEVFDDGSGAALYVVGIFDSVGGVSAANIARLSGSTWSTVGTSGLSSPAYDLCVHDDGSGPALYAAGSFVTADGLPVGGIARWNGSAWSSLGAAANNNVYALVVHDDSNGPQLYAGGGFTTLGGLPIQRLARWDGSLWHEVLGGADGAVRALASVSDSSTPWPQLFIGGDFDHIGGVIAHRIARLSDPCVGTGVSYCTAGTTASGCQATMSSTGHASRSQSSGFTVTVSQVEGQRDGVIFFGINGAQVLPWGNGSSLRCVVPPVVRTGVQDGVGAVGTCQNVYTLDFNAWMSTHVVLAPAVGTQAFLQAWFRDPGNGSNHDTSFSDALRVVVTP